jgi:hypothetical protein
MRIRNVAENTVAFIKGGGNLAARDNQYAFSARLRGKQVNDIGTSLDFGGLACRKTLKPGEVFEDKVDLRKWFAFDRLGTYEMLGSYYMEFNDPARDDWHTVWEDYATAEFTVRVAERRAACRFEWIVFEKGEWRTCGEVLVFPDATYVERSHNLWTDGRSTTRSGTLPKALCERMRAAVAAPWFEVRDGVPTYRLGIDDSKTAHPADVVELLGIVRRDAEADTREARSDTGHAARASAPSR